MGSPGARRWLTLGVFALGCGHEFSSSELEHYVACRKSSECAAEQICRFGVVDMPIVFDTCGRLAACPADGQCRPTRVCAANVIVNLSSLQICPGPVCVDDCTWFGCEDGLTCSDGGVCRPRACELPGGPSCAEHYRCDPEAALTGLGNDLTGSTVVDGANPYAQARIGCTRKSCADPGGFVCKPDWVCDPARAQHEPSGCVARPCSEIGHCEDDVESICLPVNDGTRGSSFDPHGCVVRTCEEGYQCAPGARCAIGELGADRRGCNTGPATRGVCVDPN